jgi:hypothetical protein
MLLTTRTPLRRRALASIAWVALALGGCGGEPPRPPAGDAAEHAQATAWYLSMHGDGGRNSIVGLDAAGGATVVVASPQGLPSGVVLREPRGMALLPDGTLLVASAFNEAPALLRFGEPAKDGSRPFIGTFVDLSRTVADRVHPYAVAVSPDGTVFVSDQDANLVARYAGLEAPQPGGAVPPPSGCRNQWLPPTPPADGIFIGPAHAQRSGLKVVRGIAFDRAGRLLVVDRDEPALYAYDRDSGERLATLMDRRDGLERPIQVAVDESGRVFVSDRKARTVFMRDLDGRVSNLLAARRHEPDLPSGLAVREGRLYLGDRTRREIVRIDLADPAAPPQRWVVDLPDPPEFLMALPKGR